MIQRIQTVWLLLAIAAAILSIKFPFYTGQLEANNALVALTGASYIPVLILTVITILLTIVIIFLFRNRKKQTNFLILDIILSLAIIVLYFLQIRHFLQGNISLTALFAFAVPVFLVLALTGVRRDERIIRSLNRLR